MADPNLVFTGQLGADRPEHQVAVPIRDHDVGLPIGLNYLDFDSRANLRVKAYADNPVASSAKIRIATWLDTVLYSSGCTWFEVGKNDRDFQYGVVSTKRLDRSREIYYEEVTFKKAFAEPPKIVCWLNLIDIEHKFNCRIYTGAKNITKTGFTLHIATWSDTIVFAARTTWIAHPANRSNITSGFYDTREVRPLNEPPQARCERDISFDRTFQKTPLVLTALCALDIDGRASSIRIKNLNTNITPKGMTWHLDTWGDTILHSASAQYLAIQDY
ncbi:hypothetical protein FRB95_005612 [Tulasnella sp. JGI-2019a]|nr:hypothetical protein FRB95_005612 [Tulasnella sp. JGI-2019a]